MSSHGHPLSTVRTANARRLLVKRPGRDSGMPPVNRPTRLAGVLFDVDGTLVDTTYLHAVTWWEALRQADHDVPMSTIHHAIGMGSDKILDALLGEERDRDEDGKVTDAHAALYSTYWDRLRPLPGAADLLRACAVAGQQVVLASSANER